MYYNWSGERLETFILNETAIEHLHRYALATQFVKEKKVLDIACGEGYGAALLSTAATQVTGVDINEPAIKNAAEKYRKKNLTFLQGDVRQIPLDDASIDVITSFETLEHVAEHEKVLKELRRVLKPEGILLISTPEKKFHSDLNTQKSSFHVKELYENEFRQLMASTFSHVQYIHQCSFFTSVMVPASEQTSALLFFDGDYRQLNCSKGVDPFFVIAIASDQPLNMAAQASFFKGRMMFDAAAKQAQDAVFNSVTYKAGRMVLSPFKFFQKIFRHS